MKEMKRMKRMIFSVLKIERALLVKRCYAKKEIEENQEQEMHDQEERTLQSG